MHWNTIADQNLALAALPAERLALRPNLNLALPVQVPVRYRHHYAPTKDRRLL